MRRTIVLGFGGFLVVLFAGLALIGGLQSAAAGPGGLPDLAMAPLSDISVTKTSDGHRLLRFSTVIVNVGVGVFEVRGSRTSTSDSMSTVVQRVYDATGSAFTDYSVPTTMVWGGDGHNHWHVKDLETSELIRQDNGVKVGTGVKFGYCFFDNTPYRLSLPGAPGAAVYTGCGTQDSLLVTAGLSVGWGDLYRSSLPDQYIDITDLTSGRYRLLVTADNNGWFRESNESNNATWVDLQFKGQGQPKVVAYGPAA